MPSEALRQPLLLINVVGLTPSLLGPATPRINALLQRAKMARLRPVFPAVTSTVQASILTGLPPSQHGIVGNGWYFRDLSEIWLWRQSNRLVGGEKVWDGIAEAMGAQVMLFNRMDAGQVIGVDAVVAWEG